MKKMNFLADIASRAEIANKIHVQKAVVVEQAPEAAKTEDKRGKKKNTEASADKEQ